MRRRELDLPALGKEARNATDLGFEISLQDPSFSGDIGRPFYLKVVYFGYFCRGKIRVLSVQDSEFKFVCCTKLPVAPVPCG
jgi:hypothetical protein